MNAKNLILIIIFASVCLTLVLVSLLGIYKYKPQWIGLPPNPSDTLVTFHEDSVYIEPTVKLTQKKYNQINREISEKEYFRKQSDSLNLLSKRLQDSINNYQWSLKNYQDSVKIAKYNLSQINSRSNTLIDSINKLNDKFLKAKDKANLAEKRLEEQEKYINQKEDTAEVKAFDNFAKIYNNANPRDVAKILEKIDERDAARILKMMSKKKAGKIIEAMKPEQAAAILLLGYSK